MSCAFQPLKLELNRFRNGRAIVVSKLLVIFRLPNNKAQIIVILGSKKFKTGQKITFVHEKFVFKDYFVSSMSSYYK